jgi:5-methyltetrahydropteroyltriglutamate--homocysteine methyltransferase
MEAHILGFPRIGANRELKKALESYWKGTSKKEDLFACENALKERHWWFQREQGLSMVTVGDFSFYDQMLDTICLLGMIPQRFSMVADELELDRYFRMARGDAAANIPAMEMTKWFDSNYHYLVPEFTPDMTIRRSSDKLVRETVHALSRDFRPKPVLIGPLTYISLGKEYGGCDRWSYLDAIVDVYCSVLAELAPLCDWIQLDEPILCTDLPEQVRTRFASVYQKLKQAANRSKLLLATYFGSLEENLTTALETGCDGLHIDLVRGKEQLNQVLELLPATVTLSVGLVDGRNIWKNNLRCSKEVIETVIQHIGSKRVMVASSCSLQHVPVDLLQEKILDPTLKGWMAFAVQKCREVAVLAQISGGEHGPLLRENDALFAERQADARIVRQEIRNRANAVTETELNRISLYPVRKQRQAAWLQLPLLPTTTIGSFPQTSQIRSIRKSFTSGTLAEVAYRSFIKSEIRSVIEQQERLGLDILVHGEAERNDMVEYFGQQLDGFCFTGNGWVQSYGSRCVKPPVIFGDIARTAPMTVDWISYAQSLTEKPVKGMLTGPVTILNWSFVRDDLSRAEVCKQIALAMRDEVQDLEKSGIGIIQIDEAALREGMPLRHKDAEIYLRWAVDCFRLTAAVASDETQIHTHMCYSKFNAIMPWIIAMDADVISIEASRSKMELLHAFQQSSYPNEIGPGIYDIHSPRVPEVDELCSLIRLALQVIPPERLWINPDCGLKTRQWPETIASLRNMIDAAHQIRRELSVVSQAEELSAVRQQQPGSQQRLLRM